MTQPDLFASVPPPADAGRPDKDRRDAAARPAEDASADAAPAPEDRPAENRPPADSPAADSPEGSDAGRPVVRLLAGQARRPRRGHPWIYSNEIAMDAAARAIAPGEVVRIADAGGEMLGCATFNPHSLIAARLLSRDPDEAIDETFLRRRISVAADLRARLFERPYYRLVHAEGDRLPGLVIDRFDDVFVCQANTAGMARLLPAITEALEALFVPRAVVLRADSPARALEGLDAENRLLAGAIDGPVAVEDGGLRAFADVLEGQKTGWYFDQCENRGFVAGLARGARMLDLYAYAGGFALRAAAAGAAEAVAVDRSDLALDLGRRAAAENGLEDRCRFVRAEAFAEMARLAREGERFDIVVADPPSFVKNRRALKPGLRGYRKLARMAAALVAPGGFLFIASCSHNVAADAFAEAVRQGLHDAERGGRILRASGAGPDHPQHPALPESAYLKALTLQLD